MTLRTAGPVTYIFEADKVIGAVFPHGSEFIALADDAMPHVPFSRSATIADAASQLVAKMTAE